MLGSWIGKLLQRGRRGSTRRQETTTAPKRFTFRPQLESLEVRTVPSVTIQFDYSYDASGWFTSQRRGILDLAGRTLGTRFNDALAAITPGGSNFWQATFWHPSNGSATHLTNLTVPANTLIIYVGSYAIDGPGATIAQAGFGGHGNVTGSSTFQNTVRGRRTTPLDATRDFQSWGGQISFDTSESWYFGTSTGATASQTDFLAVTLHELTHILGFTEWNTSFSSWVTAQNAFTGPLAVAAFGGAVPLDAEHEGRSHWAHEIRHGGKETLLDPYIALRQRKLLTGLDWAGLGDVGWELSADADATIASARSVHDPYTFAAAVSGTTTTFTATQFALDDPLDVDLFRVHAAAGQLLTIRTAARAGETTTNTLLRLFDATGRELARADNGEYDILNYTVTTAGVYYVGVSSNPNSEYSATEAFAQALGGTAGAYNVTVTVSGTVSGGPRSGRLIVAADAGTAPLVRVFDAASGGTKFEFYAYAPTFLGGVRVAQGDVTGDGVADIITAPGPGGGPHVRVFDGRSGALFREFFAYAPYFTGGVFVAAGDLNGDGRADIITGPDVGGGAHVRAFSGTDGSIITDYFAYGSGFRGGVRVAAGDYNGDGRVDIFTAAGPGGGPHVRVLSGVDRSDLASFFAYSSGFTGGVYIAAGDLDGDGRAEVIAGAGAGGGPHVQAFRGSSAALMHSFFAYDNTFRGGVRVTSGDVNGDGRDDLIVAAGPGGGLHVRSYNGATGQIVVFDFFPFGNALRAGVFVAGQ